MAIFPENQFSPKGLRLFYLFLAGLVAVSGALFYDLVFFHQGDEDLATSIRILMVRSWWMVVIGVITFSAAYVMTAFFSALREGQAQPFKPSRRMVFVVAVAFGLVHSFRLAYGGNPPIDFIVIFLKDLCGILLALAVTLIRPIKGTVYRREGKAGGSW